MLETFQRRFAEYLTSGNDAPLSEFLGSQTDREVLKVYRNGFFKACQDALASNFPAVRHLVGEAYFTRLARRFVEANPPHSGALARFGDGFAAFVETLHAEHGLDYLSDVARLDAVWLDAYFAADESSIDGAAVTVLVEHGTDLEQLRLTTLASVGVCHTGHDVVQVWTALRDGPLTARAAVLPKPQKVLLWRQQGHMQFRLLPPAEHRFITGLREGRSLGAAAAAANTLDSTFDVSSTFAALLMNGILKQS